MQDIYTHGGGQVIRSEYPDFDVFGKVTIGDNALVAAGSVVTKSVAPRTIVAGNPAKVIGKIDDYYQRIKSYDVKSKKLSPKEKKILLLSLSEDKFIQKIR